MPSVPLRPDGAEHPIEVELQPSGDDGAFAARVADRRLDVTIVADGPDSGFLLCDGGVRRFHLAADGSTIHVWIAGRTCRIETAVGRRAGRSARPPVADSGEVIAPMPGTIQQVFVRPGDRVEVHQPLLVMVSMKMELTVAAGRAGRVRAVECQEGRLVEMGQVLVRIEESDAS
jgi:3-methylcrotonyl-CoA carboxylase alpha subunit